MTEVRFHATSCAEHLSASVSKLRIADDSISKRLSGALRIGLELSQHRFDRRACRSLCLRKRHHADAIRSQLVIS